MKFRTRAGMDQAVARGLAYAPYCDLLWMETAVPDIGEENCLANGWGSMS